MIQKIFIRTTLLSVRSMVSANALEEMPISLKAGQCF